MGGGRMTKVFKERRKHPRFNGKEETALLTAPKVILSDNLIDVSMGGLAFSYKEEVPFQAGVMIQIEIIRDDIVIEGIPAKIINDIEMPSNPKSSRRCGVAFGKLSELQKEKIAFLVKKFEPGKP
jgi:hypothetical protein